MVGCSRKDTLAPDHIGTANLKSMRSGDRSQTHFISSSYCSSLPNRISGYRVCEAAMQPSMCVKMSWWCLFHLSFIPRCMKCRHGLAMRILSDCLSVRQTRGLWQNGRKICPDFYTVRKIILRSCLRKNSWYGATTTTWNFRSTGPRCCDSADFEQIIARSVDRSLTAEALRAKKFN